MKLINRKNFFSIVCISFTLLVCYKLIYEWIVGFKDPNYTMNIFLNLLFAVIITAILAIHFYLQKYPFIPVFLGQYSFTMIITFLVVKIAEQFVELAPTAYRDMFVSVTIPFIVGAAVYYISFFRQIRKANKMLEELNN